ncbi:microbial collagenase [Colwellia chukchiensis]|uniref:Microbial collagenase n=1 Tax=Colwellia chukchiensis TaxID=641665 RepID=A0A1H7L669_9GAMM|nr:collagenase [Colwellia chukchiensis]SEK94458.1 microbial collagenase [Colwellia chukchiensis]
MTISSLYRHKKQQLLKASTAFVALAAFSHSAFAHQTQLAAVDKVLAQVTDCNATIVIRSQALTAQQLAKACQTLIAQEDNFHQVFATRAKPVADDHNLKMRANVYASRDDFVKYAGAHFNMPTDNGGMYLEGYPDRPGNQAEFVAYQRDGKIWNLAHEYIHYLDGRFNKYGDYCNGLHDDHAGPEFCPSPNLPYPHIVWWAEGLAEYLAWGKSNPKAVALAATQNFSLSELFNTSSNENTGADRVYRWGYLAVRYMMENHRGQIDAMLERTRSGDWLGYQRLVKSWGQQFDADFNQWLMTLNAPKNSTAS